MVFLLEALVFILIGFSLRGVGGYRSTNVMGNGHRHDDAPAIRSATDHAVEQGSSIYPDLKPIAFRNV